MSGHADLVAFLIQVSSRITQRTNLLSALIAVFALLFRRAGWTLHCWSPSVRRCWSHVILAMNAECRGL